MEFCHSNHKGYRNLSKGDKSYLIWGSGHIYNGARSTYGAGLIVVEILEHLPLTYLGFEAAISFPIFLYPIQHILMSLLFAFDGYKDVKR